MFDNLLMSMNSKLKKIISSVGANEEKLNEVSMDVATVHTTSNEIKALIGTEIATQLSTLEANIIAAMPSGSSGLTSCIRNVQRGTFTIPASSDGKTVDITLTGFTNVSNMVVRLYGCSAELATGNGVSASILPYVKTLTVSKLTAATDVFLDSSYSGRQLKTATGSYEVIEYY